MGMSKLKMGSFGSVFEGKTKGKPTMHAASFNGREEARHSKGMCFQCLAAEGSRPVFDTLQKKKEETCSLSAIKGNGVTSYCPT